MMKQAFTKLGVFTLLSLLCPAFLYAQVVTDERMFSLKIRKYRNVFPPPGLNYLSPIHIIKTENIRWNGRLIPVPYWNLRKI